MSENAPTSKLPPYDPVQRLMWGGELRSFALTGEHRLNVEIEVGKALAKIDSDFPVSAGLGAIMQRLISQTWFACDITVPIKHALVGGGMSPNEAANLLSLYGPPARPDKESLAVAAKVMEHVLYGNIPQLKGKKAG